MTSLSKPTYFQSADDRAQKKLDRYENTELKTLEQLLVQLGNAQLKTTQDETLFKDVQHEFYTLKIYLYSNGPITPEQEKEFNTNLEQLSSATQYYIKQWS